MTVRRGTREDYLGSSAFSLYAAFHNFYESLKADPTCRSELVELVVEPLFIFARYSKWGGEGDFRSPPPPVRGVAGW